MTARPFYIPLALVLALKLTVPVAAQDDLDAEQLAQIEQIQAIVQSLQARRGEVILDGGLATLNVPDQFDFFGPDDAEKILVDLWGNPPGQDVLGMLFPAEYSPLDRDAWAATIDYVEDGYVSDDDAADIDYDELLQDMRSDIRSSNRARVDAGYDEVELLGWAEPPHYDVASKKLYWAKELRFGDSDETTLNYEIRALGRRGVINVTFIAATRQLDEINASRESVLSMAEFNDGHRYADFNPSVDKVAAYGIGALVAGKVAAKIGLLGAGLLLLKKFGIFLLLGLGAFGRKLKSLFGGSKPAD